MLEHPKYGKVVSVDYDFIRDRNNISMLYVGSGYGETHYEYIAQTHDGKLWLITEVYDDCSGYVICACADEYTQ